jgi:hypothetical protein
MLIKTKMTAVNAVNATSLEALTPSKPLGFSSLDVLIILRTPDESLTTDFLGTHQDDCLLRRPGKKDINMRWSTTFRFNQDVLNFGWTIHPKELPFMVLRLSPFMVTCLILLYGDGAGLILRYLGLRVQGWVR